MTDDILTEFFASRRTVGIEQQQNNCVIGQPGILCIPSTLAALSRFQRLFIYTLTNMPGDGLVGRWVADLVSTGSGDVLVTSVGKSCAIALSQEKLRCNVEPHGHVESHLSESS